MNLNCLLARKFKPDGYSEQSNSISKRSKEAALKDFRKLYSPESERGMRGTKFGWATAAVAIDEQFSISWLNTGLFQSVNVAPLIFEAQQRSKFDYAHLWSDQWP